MEYEVLFNKDAVLVCDGGIDHNVPISPPPNKVCIIVFCHPISDIPIFVYALNDIPFAVSVSKHNIKSWFPLKTNQHLYSPSPPSCHRMGLSLPTNDGCRPFTLIPREATVSHLPKSGMSQLFDSLSHILSLHRTSLSRGKKKTIFCDPTECVMYKTLGVRAPMAMAATGVLDYDPWAESIDTIHWVRVMKMVKRAELLFESFAGSEVLDHIQRAKEVVPFKTMHAPRCHQAHAKYFGAIALGCNVFLCCHDDNDFTISMAHVLLGGKDQYNLDDNVVIYFCFPTLGVAIPMRPGDYLIFNSHIPHCISSRCRHANKIMCISMF